jgi:hypothetical protein
MAYLISNQSFENELRKCLYNLQTTFDHNRNSYIFNHYKFVTGPGRSGAIASVYTSYFTKLNFIPYKQLLGHDDVLVIDTVVKSGKTLRAASKHYDNAYSVAVFNDPNHRYRFWYENYKRKQTDETI